MLSSGSKTWSRRRAVASDVMAARLWRSVLGVQAALAVVIALLIVRRAPGSAHLWLGVDVAALCFAALQYLQGFAIIAVSRALAPAAPQAGWWPALRAALTEPVHFLCAQLAMARNARTLSSSPPGARGPLLLVHGLACNAGVWAWLMPRLRTAGFGPIHAVELAPMGTDVDSLARTLAREVSVFHAQAGTPVTLLAHSLGGLACRAALRLLDPRWVSALVTVGTPHHGAALARLARIAPLPQLRPDSPWLAALNARREPPGVAATSIYSLDDDFVTPASSAELAGARSLAVRGLGHFGLLVSRRGGACILQALREAA